MAKKKRAINFKAFADDVKEGMTDSDLMGKYNLSHTQLDRVLEKLLDAGRLQLSDIEGRGSGFEATVQVAFTCPSCGALKFFDSSKCPECGFDDSASGGLRNLETPAPKKKKRKAPKRNRREVDEETVRLEAAVEAALSAKLEPQEPSTEPVKVAGPAVPAGPVDDEFELSTEEAELDFKESLDEPTPPKPEPLVEPRPQIAEPEPEKPKAKAKKTKTKKPKPAAPAPKKGKGRGKRLVFLIAAELLFAVVVLGAVAYFTDMLPLPEGWLPRDQSAKKTTAFKSTGVERQETKVAMTADRRPEQPPAAAGRTVPRSAGADIAGARPEAGSQPAAQPQPVSKPPTVEKPESPRTPPTEPKPRPKSEPDAGKADEVSEKPPASPTREKPDEVIEKPAESPPGKPDAMPGSVARVQESPDRDRVTPEPATPVPPPGESKAEEKPVERPVQAQEPVPPEPVKTDRTTELAARSDRKAPEKPETMEETERSKPEQPAKLASRERSREVPTEPAEERPEEASRRLAHARPVEPTPPERREVVSERKPQPVSPPDERIPTTGPRMAGPDLGKALATATKEGDMGAVNDLLAAGADPGAADTNGVTVLIHACALGNAEMAELLLRKGADPNAGDPEGNTPLMIAAGTGHLELVKILLENGADVDIRNSKGVTALGWAYSPTTELVSLKNQRKVVKLLKEYGRKHR